MGSKLAMGSLQASIHVVLLIVLLTLEVLTIKSVITHQKNSSKTNFCPTNGLKMRFIKVVPLTLEVLTIKY